MELAGEYDCVVLGDHPAGLWAALHLSGFEKKVLVVPLESSHGVSSLPRQVALDFGWTPEDWERGEDLLQILTPERRFRVPDRLDAFEREYEFQFGVPPELDSHVSNEIVRGLAYYARGGENGPVLGSEWRQWANLCFQTIHFERDPGFVIRRMLRQLSARGVHVSRPGALNRIFLDRGSLAGVQLSGSSRMIAAKSGFLCAHLDYLRSLMSEPLALNSDPQGWSFFMKFSCEPSSLPSGIGSRMVYVEDSAPILEIRQSRAGEFLLSTQLPMRETSFDRGYQRRLCERMLKVCQRVIPDLEYNLRGMTPELRDPDRAEKTDLPQLHPFHEIQDVPLDRLIYGASRGLGHATSVGNLYLVHPESDPSQGMWGSFRASVASMEALLRGDARNQSRSAPQLMI